MLLEFLDALPPDLHATVLLPTDLPHPQLPLCSELQRRGVTTSHVDLPIMRRSYRTPRQLARLSLRAVRLRAVLRSLRPDIVYCTTSASLLAAPVARLSGVGVVVGHLQEIWTAHDRRVLSPLARFCHRVLAISDAVAASAPEGLRARTTVVPNATPEPQRWSSLAGRSGPLRFLVASRWNGWKGHATLLAAWDRLHQAHELTVLGGPPAAGSTVDVAALVDGLRDPQSVVVIGEVAEPDEYLDRADVVIVPSDQPEPFGLVAIEAFARGRPVIGSASGGMLDIITDGVDGWLFPPGDVEALATVLSSLSRTHVEAAGSCAREKYEERFTTGHYAQRWLRAFADGAPATSP